MYNLQCNIFSSLFHRANVKSGLYFGTNVEEAADVMFVLNWFLAVYSGKASSAPL